MLQWHSVEFFHFAVPPVVEGAGAARLHNGLAVGDIPVEVDAARAAQLPRQTRPGRQS